MILPSTHLIDGKDLNRDWVPKILRGSLGNKLGNKKFFSTQAEISWNFIIDNVFKEVRSSIAFNSRPEGQRLMSVG